MRLLMRILKIIALIASWAMLIYLFSLTSPLTLVPLGTATAVPQIGTWQRTIQDFFGEYFINDVAIILFSIATAILIIRILTRNWNTAGRIALINLLFFIGGYIIFASSLVASKLFFPENYARQIVPVITIGVIFCLWFFQIKHLSNRYSKQKNKAKNSLTKPSISRLIDYKTEDNVVNHQDNHMQSEHFASQ